MRRSLRRRCVATSRVSIISVRGSGVFVSGGRTRATADFRMRIRVIAGRVHPPSDFLLCQSDSDTNCDKLVGVQGPGAMRHGSAHKDATAVADEPAATK